MNLITTDIRYSLLIIHIHHGDLDIRLLDGCSYNYECELKSLNTL